MTLIDESSSRDLRHLNSEPPASITRLADWHDSCMLVAKVLGARELIEIVCRKGG